MADRNEPVQQIKERRDGMLRALVARVPFAAFMNIRFDRRGDELTGIMAYDAKLIGNPAPAALHGGATAAFLETVALIDLAWETNWAGMEEEHFNAGNLPRMPRTIDFTIDYLRPGLPRDAYARARVNRSGRRYASVHVEAWQDRREVLFAQATGHFMMPQDG